MNNRWKVRAVADGGAEQRRNGELYRRSSTDFTGSCKPVQSFPLYSTLTYISTTRKFPYKKQLTTKLRLEIVKFQPIQKFLNVYESFVQQILSNCKKVVLHFSFDNHVVKFTKIFPEM